MSKPVRLPDYLHAEVERLAKADRRSTASMVQLLLEQALQMPAYQPRTGEATNELRVETGELYRAEKSTTTRPPPVTVRSIDVRETGLTEPGGARPEAGSVTPKDNRRDTDARRADLGARSLDVPGSVSPELTKGAGDPGVDRSAKESARIEPPAPSVSPKRKVPLPGISSAEAAVAAQRLASSGKCLAYAPAGTKCKYCGKVH